MQIEMKYKICKKSIVSMGMILENKGGSPSGGGTTAELMSGVRAGLEVWVVRSGLCAQESF